MRSFSVVCICCAACILASCAQFTLADANMFYKGMTISEVENVVSRSPQNTFEVNLPSSPNKRYFIEQYIIAFGDYKSVYFCAYEGGGLLYWGYPLEFNRHPDATLNELGRAATAAYDRAK
ncbi:hypothetical protein MASR2M18_09370 [Ignavibacteria bacterium]|nr:hypothetical protein [Bacteroidota bacterium]MCZ2133300.1 hypothetical protein [Bacteroidota bacterium]